MTYFFPLSFIFYFLSFSDEAFEAIYLLFPSNIWIQEDGHRVKVLVDESTSVLWAFFQVTGGENW